MQTCHFDLTQNLNESEKKSEKKKRGKNLNLSIRIALFIKKSLPISKQKNPNFESGHLNFTKFQDRI